MYRVKHLAFTNFQLYEHYFPRSLCSPLPAQLKAHGCLPFTGCTVTVTGLEERERRKVRQAVEANGGVYSGELTKDVCTHLLVGSTTSTFTATTTWQFYMDSISVLD